MTLHHIFVGVVSITLLAACGGEDPQPQPESTENEAADVEIPDIVIPENE